MLRARADGVAALKARDELVHDLRHPLGAARWYLQILQNRMNLGQTPSREELLPLVSGIEDSIAGLWRQIDTFLVSDGPMTKAVELAAIERVVTNLVTNAVAYSSDGGDILIRVERHGNEAIVVVQDQGSGIASDELPHIFEPYWRGSKARIRSPGAGLGLASARAIVEQHGGTIDVASVEGRGTTFTVRLPLRCG